MFFNLTSKVLTYYTLEVDELVRIEVKENSEN